MEPRPYMKSLAVAFLVWSMYAATAASAGGPDYLYPDLIPFIRPDQPFLQNWILDGDELRIETVFANAGDGLLQIRVDRDSASGDTADVYQRVFIGTDNGLEYEDFFASRSVFHMNHGHLHLEDFAEFQLRAVTVEPDGSLGVGDLVASNVKTSFLIHDSFRLPDLRWADAPSYPSFNMGRSQNISVGHGDVYSHYVEGQFIPVADVPRGPLYWLRQTVDPSDVLRETNEANNSVEILIDLNEQEAAKKRADGQFIQPGDFYPLLLGDLDFDQRVTWDDWLLFREGMGTDPAGLAGREAYLTGDLNLDGRHSPADFLLFQTAFAEANGASAATSLSAVVPEPATATLLMVLVFSACGMALRPRSTLVQPIAIRSHAVRHVARWTGIRDGVGR